MQVAGSVRFGGNIVVINDVINLRIRVIRFHVCEVTLSVLYEELKINVFVQ